MELLLPLLPGMNLHIAQTPLSESTFVSQLEHCKPDLVIATPLQLHQLASLASRQNLPYLTHVFTANVDANDPAISLLLNRQIEVFACAGLNQTSSVFAINLDDFIGSDIVGKPMQQENQKAMSIGKAMPGVTVKIADPNGTELEPESWGSLWIKGACVALMHRIQSDCQVQLFDGWLQTNWTARMDAQGFIFVAHPHSNLHTSFLIQ
jgi:acyl-coenzyme A synthetase/AMP-(fatty) acid ligase